MEKFAFGPQTPVLYNVDGLVFVGRLKRRGRDDNVTFLKPFIEIQLLSECSLEHPLGILGKCVLWVEG